MKFSNICLILLLSIILGCSNNKSQKVEPDFLSDTPIKNRENNSIEKLKEQIRKNPNDANLHYKFGLAYAYNLMIDNAISEYKEAIRLKPDHCDACTNLVIQLSQKDLHDEAISVCENFIKNSKDNWCIDFIKGNLESEKQYKELEAKGLTYQQAAGVLYEESRKETLKTLKRNPDDACAHFGLALDYELKGEIDKAIEEYKKGMALEKNSINKCSEYSKLAELYEKKEAYKDVVKNYEEFIKCSKDWKWKDVNLTKEAEEKVRKYKDIR